MDEGQWVRQIAHDWEYHQVLLDQNALENHLNKLDEFGQDRWELVSVTSLNVEGSTVGLLYTFKKPDIRYIAS